MFGESSAARDATATGTADTLYKGIGARAVALTNSKHRSCEDVIGEWFVFAHATWPKQKSMPEKKPVIAIVDDDEAVRDAVASLIRSLGYEALRFSSGQELLDSPRRRDISCLISDVQMLGMTGVELYERLAASETPIPTILITAYPKDEVRDRALNAGVLCYLKKPFTEADLLACIQASLARSGA